MYSAMHVYMVVQGSLTTAFGGLQEPLRKHEQEDLQDILTLSTRRFKTRGTRDSPQQAAQYRTLDAKLTKPDAKTFPLRVSIF